MLAHGVANAARRADGERRSQHDVFSRQISRSRLQGRCRRAALDGATLVGRSTLLQRILRGRLRGGSPMSGEVITGSAKGRPGGSFTTASASASAASRQPSRRCARSEEKSDLAPSKNGDPRRVCLRSDAAAATALTDAAEHCGAARRRGLGHALPGRGHGASPCGARELLAAARRGGANGAAALGGGGRHVRSVGIRPAARQQHPKSAW